MRNARLRLSGITRSAGPLMLGLAILPWIGGCLDGGSKQILARAYTELGAKDYEAADADADEFLRAHPSGQGVAETYYLKGRIEELKAQDPQISPTITEKRDHLDKAKDAYTVGLQSSAPQTVKAMLHTGVANVDYFEEDYLNAMADWRLAYDNLPDEAQKARVLYQIGRCQQRLGLFSQADATFAQVQRLYPESDSARWAANRSGATGFYVEVGLFPDATNAEKAADALRKKGMEASCKPDMGRQLLRVGPIPSYADAKAVQSRLCGQFPKAIISP